MFVTDSLPLLMLLIIFTRFTLYCLKSVSSQTSALRMLKFATKRWLELINIICQIDCILLTILQCRYILLYVKKNYIWQEVRCKKETSQGDIFAENIKNIFIVFITSMEIVPRNQGIYLSRLNNSANSIFNCLGLNYFSITNIIS